MQTQTINSNTSADKKLFVNMVLDAWDTYNTRFNKIMDTLTKEQLSAETAPGRNSGIYLAGHLIAVSDSMLPLLGFGEKLYPELENIFLASPDKSGLPMPSIDELRIYRDDINKKLSDQIAQSRPEEWFKKHTAVSEENFAKEPHRNKLNIMINRTNHLSYHLGQLAYLVQKKSN